MVTAGLGKARKALVLKNLLDFSVRMISDVWFGGQDPMWAAAMNLAGMFASGLFLLSSYGKKLLGGCFGRFGGCFVGGTPVAVGFEHDSSNSGAVATACKTITKSIESIRLGSRVISNAPNSLTTVEGEFGVPDQATWSQINFLQRRSDGTEIQTELIRPKWWIECLGLQVGSVIDIPHPEFETGGRARLLGFEECPPIQPGDGEVVIGRFWTRRATNLIRVTLQGGESFTGTTNHPVWSEDSLDWKPLEELIEGEQIRSLAGPKIVELVERISEPRDVYNIEVDKNLVYHLLEAGILVHNLDYSPVSLSYNYTKLANAIAPGIDLKALGQTAHHILSDSLKDKPGLKMLFQRAAGKGWDLNGVLNGIALVKGKGSVAGVEHVGNHLKYTKWVEARLRDAIEDAGGVNGDYLKDGANARKFLEEFAGMIRGKIEANRGKSISLIENW
jgi:hypothetical protein